MKLAGVPQTTGSISAASSQSSPYCGDIWRRYCFLTSFFPIVDMCLSCEDIAWQSCTMVRRWRLFGDFLRPAFPASRVQHVSDLHSKFALRPRHVWKYGRHPICDGWDQERKEKKKKEQTTGWKYIWPALLHRAAINNHASETQKYYNIRCTKTTKKAQVWSPLTISGVEKEWVYSQRKSKVRKK